MHSPRTKKFKTSISVKKIMVSIFWDRKGILLVDFMPPGATINATAYCDTLTWLRWAIQNKRRGMLLCSVCLLHDRVAPFHACHHCASGKIQVGYIGPSAIHSGLHTKQFLLVSSPKETSRWEKVWRWWWGARRSHDVVQRAGGRLLWLGDTEDGSKT